MGLPHSAPPFGDELSAPFWAAIEEGRIVLPRCSECGSWQWYPDEAGCDCPGATLRWEEVAPTGTVYTATRVERAFLPGGQGDVPFTVAFVELDGVDGVRLVTNLAEDAEVGIGDRVRADFVDHDGHKHLVFVPA